MIVVCGIHGSGKDRYCKNLKLKDGINTYTASQLINQVIPLRQNRTKRIDKIDERQSILLEAIKEISSHENNFILNAHLCLVNQSGKIERIALEIFQNMPITEIYLVECSAKEIKQRIYDRDRILWDEAFINSFLEEEKKYAVELSRLLKVPLCFVDTNSDSRKILFYQLLLDLLRKYYLERKNMSIERHSAKLISLEFIYMRLLLLRV